MLNFIATWQRERKVIRELAHLSDRELHDVGVARDDISTIVRRATSQSKSLDMAPSWAAQNRRALSA